MEKHKANIRLSNISEIKYGGIRLALRKGFNELRNKSNILSRSSITHLNNTNAYKDILSVIICTYDRPTSAAEAAKSVTAQLPQIPFEVIVVNNSDREFPKTLLPDGVRLISEPRLGLSRARNTGARHAHGEYLLYIDDDAIAMPRLAETMYNAFIKHPDCAIIGGQIYLKLPNPVPEIFLPGREALWSAYTVPYKRFRKIRGDYELPYGACFGIRHSALDTLGGFSEDFGRCGNNFAGGEETALCYLAKNSGMKIGIEPQAAVRHMVDESRFSAEHVRRTIYEGTVTYYRLCKAGYTGQTWTETYVRERLKIAHTEAERLKKRGRETAAFYKECEISAFEAVLNIIEEDTECSCSSGFTSIRSDIKKIT